MVLCKASKRIAIALCIYFLFTVVSGIVIAEYALHPLGRKLTETNLSEANQHAIDDDAALTEVSIRAQDNAILRGWELRPEEWNGNSVIVLHGLRDNRSAMLDYADILLARGYDVLLPDARAHGASEGRVATYGLLESDDIHRWQEWITSNEHPVCTYGFGESMGAAQLLQSLPVTRFCAVAAECPFATYRETAYDRMGQPFHLGPWVGRTALRPVVETAFAYARLRYGLNMERVSPEDAVAATHVPVLLIHGRSDRNIPIRHSLRIQSRRSSGVALWDIPNTGHSNAIDTSPQELQARLIQWFEQHSTQ